MREQRLQVLARRARRVARRRSGSGTRPARRTRRPARTRRKDTARALPKRRRLSFQISVTRAMSRCERRPTTAARRRARGCTSSSRCAAPRSPSASRAQIERAHARATGSAGHMPGCRSARYSAIASESQTTVVAVVQARHERRRRERAVVGLRAFARQAATCTSLNGAPESLAASQPRSDHDE